MCKAMMFLKFWLRIWVSSEVLDIEGEGKGKGLCRMLGEQAEPSQRRSWGGAVPSGYPWCSWWVGEKGRIQDDYKTGSLSFWPS